MYNAFHSFFNPSGLVVKLIYYKKNYHIYMMHFKENSSFRFWISFHVQFIFCIYYYISHFQKETLNVDDNWSVLIFKFLSKLFTLKEVHSDRSYGNNCLFKQSKMFSMSFSAMNLDKFIWSIGPRDPPYSLGRQLRLTCLWKDSKLFPWKWTL